MRGIRYRQFGGIYCARSATGLEHASLDVGVAGFTAAEAPPKTGFVRERAREIRVAAAPQPDVAGDTRRRGQTKTSRRK